MRLDLVLSGSAMKWTLVKKLSICMEQVRCTPLGLIVLCSEGDVHTVCRENQKWNEGGTKSEDQ